MKGTTFETGILTFAHHPLHVLLGDLQILRNYSGGLTANERECTRMNDKELPRQLKFACIRVHSRSFACIRVHSRPFAVNLNSYLPLRRVSVQMIDNLIDPSHSGHAVLSQNFLEQLEDLLPPDRAALDQAWRHSQMLDHRLPPGLGFFLRLPWGWLGRGSTPLVEIPFLPLALGGLIVGHTATGGLLLAMGLFAAESATQLIPPTVTRIGEKEDLAMPAALQASSQLGLGFQDRSQKQIILQHQRTGLFPAVPVLAKLKMLLDLC